MATLKYSLFLVSLSLCLNSSAAVYKWVDDEGVTHYSDDPRHAPEEHTQIDHSLPPVHVMDRPDKALSKVQRAADKERAQRYRARIKASRTPKSSGARCETYKRQLDKIQAQLRRGYREPRGNKLRERRRELSARIKQACY